MMVFFVGMLRTTTIIMQLFCFSLDSAHHARRPGFSKSDPLRQHSDKDEMRTRAGGFCSNASGISTTLAYFTAYKLKP